MAAAPDSALDWLYGTQLFGIKLGLENVHRLLAAMDLPSRTTRFIHVAGTNGKGSTCAFMHAILREAGINAGLFTSPHLIRFNERIRDSHRMISDQEIEAGLSRIRALVQNWRPHPTFFEIALVLALDWFRQRGLEWVILETGLGGRPDATNAISPAATVITSVSWDHMEVLGDTLAKIATEKAGIFKPGVPAVTQVQPPEVQEVLEQHAARVGVPLAIVEPLPVSAIGLPGAHQRQNAALAINGLRAAGVEFSESQAEAGLAAVKWPGRFQIIGTNSDLVIDGAHNLDAARRLVETWQEQFPGEKTTVIFGAATGKDISAMLRTLAPIASSWVLTSFQSPRAVTAKVLKESLDGLGISLHVTLCYNLAEALDLPTSGKRLVVGSLYLVGELLALLEDQEFEASLQ